MHECLWRGKTADLGHFALSQLPCQQMKGNKCSPVLVCRETERWEVSPKVWACYVGRGSCPRYFWGISLFAYCNHRASHKHRFSVKLLPFITYASFISKLLLFGRTSFFPAEHVLLFCYSFLTKVGASEAFTARIKSLRSRIEGHKPAKGLTKWMKWGRFYFCLVKGTLCHCCSTREKWGRGTVGGESSPVLGKLILKLVEKAFWVVLVSAGSAL